MSSLRYRFLALTGIISFASQPLAQTPTALPADHVLSTHETRIEKMPSPEASVCNNYTRKHDALCHTELPAIPTAYRAQYLNYVLEAANGLHGVPPALIMSSIAVETSFLGPRLENLEEKEAWMTLNRRGIIEPARENLLCYAIHPFESPTGVALPTGTHLQIIFPSVYREDSDHDGVIEAEERYDRVAITLIPGVTELPRHFTPEFAFQQNEILCTVNHKALRARIQPDYEAETIHGYLWGKGIAQFGQNNAADYGLDWRADRPMDEAAAWAAEYNRDRRPGELWPIWSPRGSILAKTQYLRNFWDRQYHDEVRGPDHQPWTGTNADQYRVDFTYRFNEAHLVRYVIGMYNRGEMPANSLKEGYRQYLQLPSEYIQAWHIPRLHSATVMTDGVTIPSTTPSGPFPILQGEYKNRCHVAKVNRVCGLTHQGYMGTYVNLFQFRDGQWQLR